MAEVFSILATSRSCGNIHCSYQHYQPGKTTLHFSVLMIEYLVAKILPLRADFYRFYDVVCKHCEFIVVLKRCQLLEKKRLHRFIKPQLLNFRNLQPGKFLGSCLGFDLNLSLSP